MFARGHGLAPRRRTESAEIAMNPDAPVLLLSNDELVMIFEWLEAGERCTMSATDGCKPCSFARSGRSAKR